MWHDTDNGIGLAVDVDGLTEDTGDATVTSLPKSVAEEDYVMPRRVLVRSKGPAEHRLHAEHWEERGGNPCSHDPLWLVTARDIDRFISKSANGTE